VCTHSIDTNHLCCSGELLSLLACIELLLRLFLNCTVLKFQWADLDLI
jgi:hypothetical protein